MYMCNKKKEGEQEVDKEYTMNKFIYVRFNSDTYLMVKSKQNKSSIFNFNFNTYLIMNIMHYLMP